MAWGPITHMTLLDEILKDPGLNPEVKKVLQDNLKYAKGGVVGPDMFYFNNKRYSDIAHYCSPADLAKKILEMAKIDGDPQKIAFAYGWMIHVATDPIGHPWVNSLAGGEYDPNNAAIKKQHSHIEQSIDKKNYIEHAKKMTDPITGEVFAYYYDMDIDSPDIFTSKVFSNLFGCSENAPPPYIGEDAENVSQLLYHLYPTWVMRKDENEFNTPEYQEAYQESIYEAVDALNSSGGTLKNWDLDTGETPYDMDGNPNIKYGGHEKCKEYGKLKNCGPVTRKGPGGDHPDDTVSVGNGTMGYESALLNSLFRLAPQKEMGWVLWLKAIQEANADYNNLPLDTSAELRKDKLDRLSSLASQLNDPYDFREFSINNPQIQDEIEKTPDVAVLQNGYFEEMATLINKNNEPVRVVSLNFNPEIFKNHPVLVIPSGGLYGLENSEFFKASLDEYVKQGGTLIVFAQQHGYEFSVLPVPQEDDGSYKTIGGYGWSEDQSCFVNAAYIDTWHQILAGQRKSTPALHLDGYFTVYPSDSTVLLRRKANGQPALFMYGYGQGYVIVTSMYSDFALKQNQASSEEIALVRDVVSWGKNPNELPEIRPGQAVTVSVEVKNITTNDATSIKFLIYNPSRSTLLSEQTVSA
ncbi:zinc dependent phospholipase C family protein, partial [Candidatus Poribacteria bacterium]|nr:zinc dependent phospholipase C family protein [Candidatus Poribacteria bacterium]